MRTEQRRGTRRIVNGYIPTFSGIMRDCNLMQCAVFRMWDFHTNIFVLTQILFGSDLGEEMDGACGTHGEFCC